MKKMIIEDKYESEKFKKIWNELEKDLGRNELELKLLKLEISKRKRDA